ncbi:hypothetical protein CVV68_14000 [Arthrobacter livingstonensis]|uniref:HNH nuclease domain-containing protein n=1 Tax=Arthrobacter livingstonensis TaxID=670078 RepID=A0A2V5LTA9_9MICC|nr:HNH endonuclease signature motif containing protein [Arthrobacter livingstonensis]PYI66407.1 hypothetical protein CVV68_14000 [Arthrobacter livingstonensis]
MEATARMPGNPGSTQEGRGAGVRVRRLITLAEALTRSAKAASTTATPGSGTSGAGPTAFTASGEASGAASRDACPPIADGRPTAPLGMDVDSLSDAQAVSWAQELEHLGGFLAALQVQIAGNLAGRVRAGRFDGVKLPGDLLGTSLKLGRSEAARRLRLAERFLPATDEATMVTAPAAQPVTAAAFFGGELSAERALTASRYTEEARHLADAGRITDETACKVEETLTGYARTMDPDSLARVGLRTVNTLDPDGQQPTEGELVAKQGITFRQPRRGLVHFEGWATVPQYEVWMAGTGSAANPRQRTDLNSDLNLVNTGGEDTATTKGSGGGINAGTGSTRAGDDAIPGQMDLDGFLTPGDDLASQDGPGDPDRLRDQDGTGDQAEEEPGGSGGRWPPPGQGPIPDWAQGPRAETQTPAPAEPPAQESRTAQARPPEPDIADNPGVGETPAPWPHLVNGIQVPEPGSDEELPGLDPIDPACTNPVVADRRTRAQKLLDGTIEGIKLAARTGKLPMNGGLKPQLFISTTETELQRRTKCGQPGGIAFLPYSGPQPLALFSTELCDADVTTMILGNGQDILNVGRTQRLFTNAQRKILIARDKGCSFPHCTRTAMTTDAHHITPWADGGETNISNAALLCEVHHHAVHRGFWGVELINGVPWFTPCFKLDPTRTKLRNYYHHGRPDTGD